MGSFVAIRESLKRKKKSEFSMIHVYVNFNQHFSCPHLFYFILFYFSMSSLRIYSFRGDKPFVFQV